LVTSSCNLDSSEAETTEAATVVEVEAGFQIHMGPTPTRLALERKEQMARVREMNGAIANCFIKVGPIPRLTVLRIRPRELCIGRQ
jgi:hypothetical protein